MAQLVARLVRNEKVGGSNPPSSTTGRHPIRMSVFCMPGRCCGGALLCYFGAAGVPGAVGPGRCVCRWAAARPRDRHTRAFGSEWSISRPALALPPPTGTAARLSGALHTGGACVAWTSPARPCHRPQAPQPGPATTHGHRSRAPPPAHRYGRALRSLRHPPHRRLSRNSRLSLLLAAPLVFRAPSGPAAREIATREPAARKCRSRSPPVPSGPSGALHTSGAWSLMCCSARWLEARLGPRCPRAPRPATHVKPSSPLLACALPPVKPTTPLQARYTCFWCNFGEQRRRGFHGDVPMSPHWCRRFHLAAR